MWCISKTRLFRVRIPSSENLKWWICDFVRLDGEYLAYYGENETRSWIHWCPGKSKKGIPIDEFRSDGNFRVFWSPLPNRSSNKIEGYLGRANLTDSIQKTGRVENSEYLLKTSRYIEYYSFSSACIICWMVSRECRDLLGTWNFLEPLVYLISCFLVWVILPFPSSPHIPERISGIWFRSWYGDNENAISRSP